MGDLTLNISDLSANIVEQNFNGADTFLNDFALTSVSGSNQQYTVDWAATDFEVLFPIELSLDPGEIASLQYITEVSSETLGCVFGDCAVAYTSFGDPVGRGRKPGSRPEAKIIGIEASRFEFAAAFDNNTLSLLTTSDPGTGNPTIPVPVPAPFLLVLLGTAYIGLRRPGKIG
jgi:hypothetical protein